LLIAALIIPATAWNIIVGSLVASVVVGWTFFIFEKNYRILIGIQLGTIIVSFIIGYRLGL